MKLTYDGHGLNRDDDEYKTRVMTWSGYGIEQGAERDALGHTLAAAPDMLAALNKILYAHDNHGNGASNGEAILCRAFAAEIREIIKQAKGAA